MLNGILVIDKAAGMTSSDVVYQLRKALHIKKIGHAGTLDPEVTGVLPIAIGQATKLIDLLHTKPKRYVGEGLLGYATDSYDATGTTLVTQPLPTAIPSQQLQQAMQTFVGTIDQVPPIYSAVRVNGKHLYEYARAGIAVTRPSRKVSVMWYDLTADPVFDSASGYERFSFAVQCAKGTYVRALVNDLGTKLGHPAVMTHLRRVAAGGFDISQAVKLSDIVADPTIAAKYLQPISSLFNIPMVALTDRQWERVANGGTLPLDQTTNEVGVCYQHVLKAIYQATPDGYRPKLMLLQNQ